jgi:hypothetical protein
MAFKAGTSKAAGRSLFVSRKVRIMMELSIAELDAQQSDLLPAREALNHGGLFVAIGSGNEQNFINKSVALQGLTYKSSNHATSSVTIVNGVVVLL